MIAPIPRRWLLVLEQLVQILPGTELKITPGTELKITLHLVRRRRLAPFHRTDRRSLGHTHRSHLLLRAFLRIRD